MTRNSTQTIPYEMLLKKVQNLLENYAECRNIHIDSLDVHSDQVDDAKLGRPKSRGGRCAPRFYRALLVRRSAVAHSVKRGKEI